MPENDSKPSSALVLAISMNHGPSTRAAQSCKTEPCYKCKVDAQRFDSFAASAIHRTQAETEQRIAGYVDEIHALRASKSAAETGAVLRLLARLDSEEMVEAAAKAWCDQDYDSDGTFERLPADDERESFREGARAALSAVRKLLTDLPTDRKETP